MKKVTGSNEPSKKVRPALSPEVREQQMIALAVDCAEKQMLAGTASSQVITHYLKLATEKERLAAEKLRYENELIKAKTEALESQKRVDELYINALNAMRVYTGQGGTVANDEEEDCY